jgi:hypothetical protein
MKNSIRAAFLLALSALIMPTGRIAHADSDATSLKAKSPAPKLKVSKSIAFGTVKAVTSKSVTLTNSGTADAAVTLQAPGFPFSITSPSNLSFTLAAGGSQPISIQFAPTSAGKFKSEMTIGCANCTSAAQDDIAVKLSGAAKSSVVSGSPPPPPPGGGSSNALSFTVSGAFDSVDAPFASVTICATGTSNCTTVNNIIIDTASYGLRIFASQISSLGIKPNKDSGDEVGECAFFGSGTTWGSVSTVDVELAGEPTIEIPIQVIDDTNSFATPPSVCTHQEQLMSSPNEARLNGILGIGQNPNDLDFTLYFDCSGNDCSSLSNPPNADVVVDPVSVLPTDNNGIVVSLPSIPAAGEVNTTGTIYFGIGTESDNQPSGTAQSYIENPSESNPATFLSIDTVFGGVTGPGIFDTGSNGYFFDDSDIPQCSEAPGFYCPSSTLSLSATNEGLDGSASETVDFNVENAIDLFDSENTAFNDLGGINDGGSSFDGMDWGLPFFFGRTVYICNLNASCASLGTGPLTAY